MGNSGRKFSLDKKKVKALYQAMLYGGIQIKYIAYNLGVRENTLRSWIDAGNTLCEAYEDKLEELEDIFPYMYMDLWENRKEEFEAEFRRIHELDDKVPDRLYNTYVQFMDNERKKFIEENISRREREILEDIEFTDDESTNEQYRLLIRFARIYQRGVCTVEMGYLSNVNKHCSSSKNVGLSLKMLEKFNKADFADQQVVKHEGVIDVNTKSILSLALNYEKEMRQIEQNKTQIIDVQEYKQIEQKE